MLCYVGIMSVTILDWCPGIFVVSSGHSDPITAFNSLSSNQHQQQTQFPTKMPRWFCPGILKYYVLLHDVVEGEDAKYDIAQYHNLTLRSAYRWVSLTPPTLCCVLWSTCGTCVTCSTVSNTMHFITYFYVVMNSIKCVVVKHELQNLNSC